MAEYNLSSNQAHRINLDEKVGRDADDDAHAHFPDGVIEGNDTLKTYAHKLVDFAFEEQENVADLTDDKEEYRARYVDAYVKSYQKEIQDLRTDQSNI